MSFLRWLRHLLLPGRHNAYRPHLLRRPQLLVMLALVLGVEATLLGALVLRQSGHSLGAAVVEREVIALTNAERATNHASPLTENSQLDAAAKAKAADMAARGYFSHTGPNGKEPWRWIEEAGYDYQYAGENLAVRFVDSRDVVDAWMASPSHRANIVKPVYTHIGVGVAEGYYQGARATFVVQYFGKPSTTALAGLPAEVLGAAVSPQSFVDSLTRQVMKILSEPRTAAAWGLGSLAAVLMLALAFAFFHHIQVQARDLLAPGALVVGVALVLIFCNGLYLAPASQSAAVAGSGWVVDVGVATSTDRTGTSTLLSLP